jgi:hypothetical protein
MKKQTCAVLIALILISAPAFGQGWNVDLLGTYYFEWSEAAVVAYQGNYGYVGIHNDQSGVGGVAILDIFDLAHPLQVGFYSVGEDVEVLDIVPTGNYLVIGTDQDGISILNITDPRRPIPAAHIEIGAVFDMYISGTLMFVIHHPGSAIFSIFDVSDIENPELISEYTLPGEAKCIITSGDYAYVGQGSGGLWVLDISVPANPVLAGVLDLPVSSDELDRYDNMLYLAGNSAGLYTIDISRPTHPVVLGNLLGYTSGLCAFQTMVYLEGGGYGLRVVDASQPANPVVVGQCLLGPSSSPQDLVVNSSFLYAAWSSANGSMGFKVIDVTNPQLPFIYSTFLPNWEIKTLAQTGDYLYLGVGAAGLQILNVSNPASAYIEGLLGELGIVYSLKKSNDYLYLRTSTPGIKIVNVSDVTQPRLAAISTVAEEIMAVSPANNLAFAVSNDQDIIVLDLSAPENPIVIGSYSVGYIGFIPDMTVAQQYLYALCMWGTAGSDLGGDSLLILDFSNPTLPTRISGFDLNQWSLSIAVSNGYAYTTSNEQHFRITDVSDPSHPFDVDTLSIGGADAVAVSDNFAYIGCNNYGGTGSLIVMDVSNPYNAMQTGYYLELDGPEEFAVGGHLVYIADDEHFEILDCADATHNELEVNLTPLVQPIQIPASGGSFGFLVAATNAGPGNQTLELWTKVISPSGHTLSPVLGPISVAIDSGTTAWLRHQSVPGSAPAGDYTYILLAGTYPDGVWDGDTLSFVKLSTGDGPAVADWSNWGEGFAAGSTVQIPADHDIVRVSPNPFNATTVISYKLQAASHVSIKVFDTAGRLVRTLANGWREAGTHQTTFDGSNLASGVYLYKMQAGGQTATGKMLLLK